MTRIQNDLIPEFGAQFQKFSGDSNSFPNKSVYSRVNHSKIMVLFWSCMSWLFFRQAHKQLSSWEIRNLANSVLENSPSLAEEVPFWSLFSLFCLTSPFQLAAFHFDSPSDRFRKRFASSFRPQGWHKSLSYFLSWLYPAMVSSSARFVRYQWTQIPSLFTGLL